MYMMNRTNIRDFETMLKNHRFAATIENPSEFRHALKVESGLQRIALNGDPRYVDMFYRYQQQAINERRNNIGRCDNVFKPGNNSEQIHVPNMDNAASRKVPDQKVVDTARNLSAFLRFNELMRKFDWDYNKYQDRDRYNAGKQMLTEIRKLAKSQGGIILTKWEAECKRRGLSPFDARVKA